MRAKFTRLISALLLISVLLMCVTSCALVGSVRGIEITNGDSIQIEVGKTVQLNVKIDGVYYGDVEWKTSNLFIDVSDSGLVSANMIGKATITASVGEHLDTIVVEAVGGGRLPDPEPNPDTDSAPGADTSPDTDIDPEPSPEIDRDKYANMSAQEFYSDYEPATSYEDALLRSEECFMSGSLTTPDQAPIISPYQPKYGGMLVRNTDTYYSEGGNAYTVVDCYGDAVFTVYRGGGYITLEEVAAYVYAFGEVPANYDSDKNKTTVSSSEKSGWGEYLRLNDSYFSGDTSKYPYEPLLPNISGEGGSYEYYEIDIGTTGTDCDQRYDAELYNNGSYITRGAARIVYVKYEYGTKITDPDERYVFYTYNHYNDFQEYLNYYGGWGEMFGNITGGGSISSKYDYNPTDYVPTYNADLDSLASAAAYVVAYIPEYYYERRRVG